MPGWWCGRKWCEPDCQGGGIIRISLFSVLEKNSTEAKENGVNKVY